MEILVARTEKEQKRAGEILASAPILGCDTETSSLSAQNGKLFSVQFSDGRFSVLVPLSEGVGLGPLAKLLSDPKITKTFHNAKFDIDFLTANGVEVRNVFCTMVAEKILTKGANQSCSLAETLYRHFGIDLDKSKRGAFNRRWDGVWSDDLIDYALSDVLHLPRLMSEQKQWLERLGLAEDYQRQIEKSLGTGSSRQTVDSSQ